MIGWDKIQSLLLQEDALVVLRRWFNLGLAFSFRLWMYIRQFLAVNIYDRVDKWSHGTRARIVVRLGGSMASWSASARCVACTGRFWIPKKNMVDFRVEGSWLLPAGAYHGFCLSRCIVRVRSAGRLPWDEAVSSVVGSSRVQMPTREKMTVPKIQAPPPLDEDAAFADELGKQAQAMERERPLTTEEALRTAKHLMKELRTIRRLERGKKRKSKV